MILSLLQLNINADNFWDKLIPFLLKGDFDVIQLQELAGIGTDCGIIHAKRDCFAQLQQILSPTYRGELAIASRFISSKTAYLGNAIFYKSDYRLISKKIVTLYEQRDLFPSDATSWEAVGRNLLHVMLDINGENISFLNTHFAWAPKSWEHPHQTEQGKVLLEYLKKVPEPFVFTGDFNLNPEQPLINKISQLARNVTGEYKITNTLNPRLHRAKDLFPKGIAVDYIFTSKDLTIKNFSVLKEDLSDHFALTTQISL